MQTRPVRLLIASLGNPQPYHSTRHSAAHILLKAFASGLNFPPLVKNKSFGNGSVTFGAGAGRPEYTLWQSGSQMNVSGMGVMKAWKEFLSQQSLIFEGVTGLVILHDELETFPGQLKVRRGDGSAKGHNGIKSVMAILKGAGMLYPLGDRFIKIGIGIGRPASRERDDVSAFVLGQVTAKEREGIEGRVGELDMILKQEIERLGRE
jgi:peptidyl-tRNA hydrolase, PTH1 family